MLFDLPQITADCAHFGVMFLEQSVVGQPLLHAHHKLALLELLVCIPPAHTKSYDAFHGRPPCPSPLHCLELIEEVRHRLLPFKARSMNHHSNKW